MEESQSICIDSTAWTREGVAGIPNLARSEPRTLNPMGTQALKARNAKTPKPLPEGQEDHVCKGKGCMQREPALVSAIPALWATPSPKGASLGNRTVVFVEIKACGLRHGAEGFYIHSYTHIHIHIYIYVCVCVERERE